MVWPQRMTMCPKMTQIFTDREVLGFFLEVGGTLLRRRNRFKHFYSTGACPGMHPRRHILTGNTNGGTRRALSLTVRTVVGLKSLLFSLIKMAFQSLCGLLPIQAITGKDATRDASVRGAASRGPTPPIRGPHA